MVGLEQTISDGVDLSGRVTPIDVPPSTRMWGTIEILLPLLKYEGPPAYQPKGLQTRLWADPVYIIEIVYGTPK